jgi:hypothetical protein
LSFALSGRIHDLCGVASGAPVGGCARPHPASNAAATQPSAKRPRPEILIASLLKLDGGAVCSTSRLGSIAKAALPLLAGLCRLTNSHGVQQRNQHHTDTYQTKECADELGRIALMPMTIRHRYAKAHRGTTKY